MSDAGVIRPEVLDMFVQFVRLNGDIASDDPILLKALDAYEEAVPRREVRDV